jgi:predicted phosphodiesterase
MTIRTRFAHIADVHLGYPQYDLEQRLYDFGDAWLHAVDTCIVEEVKFVLIAGDLFHKRTVEPLALMQAEDGLGRLHRAKIPVYAVEGNHDRALFSDGFSWMEYLDAAGYLKLLRVATKGSREPDYRPYDAVSKQGCYVDIDGVRIVGVSYLGACAAEFLYRLSLKMQADPVPDYSVLLCHAGLEDVLPHATGTLTEAEFGTLRAYTHYVALGHIHKPFEKDGWLHNPGSLECCGSDEDAYGHGFYIVDVDTTATPAHTARHVSSRRRAWVRRAFPVDGYADPKALAEGFAAFLDGLPLAAAGDERRLVCLALGGTLSFSRRELDLRALEAAARIRLGALHVDLRNETRDVSDAVTGAADDAALSRDTLERLVLGQWFGANQAYAGRGEEWAALAAEVKEMVLGGESSAGVLSLVEKRGAELGRLPAAAMKEVTS